MLKAIRAFFSEKIPTMETTGQIIEKIHNEFDTAGEKLLAEAKIILAREDDTANGQRLIQLGFNNSKQAVNASEVIANKKKSRAVADAVQYFQQHYPNNKFITEEIVQQICKKYGLLHGDVSDYLGIVPAKNISEIESFKLKDADCVAHQCNYHDLIRQPGMHTYYLPVPEKSKGNYGYVIRHAWGYRFYSVSPDVSVVYEKPTFKICAPAKEFNTEGKTIKDGYMLIPDPIVLQPVKGGYLVVSKWGLEASDELVVNNKMN